MTKLREFEPHPLSELLPLLDKDTYGMIKADIKRNGFDPDVPILIYEGKILDGRHRYRACHELEVPFNTRQFKGTADEALDKVLRLTKDRSMTVGQRASVADSLMQGSGHKLTRNQACQVTGISVGALDKYRFVQKYLPSAITQIKNNNDGNGNSYSLGRAYDLAKGIERQEEEKRELAREKIRKAVEEDYSEAELEQIEKEEQATAELERMKREEAIADKAAEAEELSQDSFDPAEFLMDMLSVMDDRLFMVVEAALVETCTGENCIEMMSKFQKFIKVRRVK